MGAGELRSLGSSRHLNEDLLVFGVKAILGQQWPYVDFGVAVYRDVVIDGWELMIGVPLKDGTTFWIGQKILCSVNDGSLSPSGIRISEENMAKIMLLL